MLTVELPDTKDRTLHENEFEAATWLEMSVFIVKSYCECLKVKKGWHFSCNSDGIVILHHNEIYFLDICVCSKFLPQHSDIFFSIHPGILLIHDIYQKSQLRVKFSQRITIIIFYLAFTVIIVSTHGSRCE